MTSTDNRILSGAALRRGLLAGVATVAIAAALAMGAPQEATCRKLRDSEHASNGSQFSSYPGKCWIKQR